MRRLSAASFEVGTNSRAWLPDCASVTQGMESGIQTEHYTQGYLEGFDAGYADGEREARKELESAQEAARLATQEAGLAQRNWNDQLVALACKFDEAHAALEQQMESLAVTIAYAAVCRILGKAHTEQKLMPTVCREALESLHLQATQLRIAPGDKASLESVEWPCDIVADPSLQAGDCILVTGLGEVEVGVETQMRALAGALLKVLRGGETA